MKKRLSKIARDFKSNISIVVEFLRVNGYECDEDPEVESSSEVLEFIENNLPAFLFEKNKEKTQTRSSIFCISKKLISFLLI